MDEDVERARAPLNEALRGEDVLDFAGADAECERAESAVRRSVAVAADDGLAGLRDAKLGADNMNDALVAAVHVKEAHTGFAAVFLEGFKLEPGVRVNDREGAVGGGNGVVHHGEGEVGAADFAAFRAQAGKSLGRSAFVDEVAVDVDDRGLAGFFADDVGVPDFLVQRFGWHGLHSDSNTPAMGSKWRPWPVSFAPGRG